MFLKYISDAKLQAEKAQGAEPEDPDEYRALSIFWVPPEARWSHLKAQAQQPSIGQLVDDAMAGIERDNLLRVLDRRDWTVLADALHSPLRDSRKTRADFTAYGMRRPPLLCRRVVQSRD